jgi:hypothetical protein
MELRTSSTKILLYTIYPCIRALFSLAPVSLRSGAREEVGE